MGKIIQLDNALANKIAAGEVVERPASVIKELIENALDANSSQIKIEVEEGGLSLIRMIDDGDGMDEEDVDLAFHRHATSKLRNDQDLFRIATLGFRGEALPSIASVSNLLLKTSNGELQGHEIRLAGGKVTYKGSTASRKGTEIVVTDLFYNTPARLKYLKTVHTELGHISDVVNRMALAHPNVGFHLTHNGKILLQTSGNGDLLKVINDIYGSSVAKNMLHIEAEDLDFSIKGYVGKPEVTRSNRSYMSTIINGRYIRNYAINRAIQEGYHTLLPIGKFPIVVFHIEMDPILIDVNVHPAKLEVRLSKEQALQELITNTLKKLFQQTRFIPEVKQSSQKVERSKSEQMAFSLSHDMVPKQSSENKGEGKEQHRIESTEDTLNKQSQVNESDNTEEIAKNYIIRSDVQDDEVTLFSEEKKETLSVDPKTTPDNKVPPLYPIGQLHGTYILAQNDQGLFIIDQHAAQERIKYEYYREKLAKFDNTLQDLLVPLSFEFTQAEEERLKEKGHLFERIGIHLEPFGTRTYIVRSHPTWFPKGEEEALISEMLEQLKDMKTIDIGKIREEAAILMSCKAAIKANRFLTHDEMFQLLETLRTCVEPYTCPHGRPVIIHYSTYEMERMFKRIM
ncbi:DNA mismatch repair endonuclease MutL [Evansella cellulosilytica]|uniref:DNA mismatch repair protein MutL n=1 Tax=Evansella cellulosilytica (strain ATCC 21833 / DSM 2522 / FERM P-1141 / JCM 9156 / N-4) TaxID=649639 RepID=E6TS18_EVAC2|nr:DNA mismatch repair endonuclease MutL [Evansella cellulosilytica]ADU30672.1 DNA mismatch repair protein MutL [Evansella cellulosilytica DSM 2522]